MSWVDVNFGGVHVYFSVLLNNFVGFFFLDLIDIHSESILGFLLMDFWIYSFISISILCFERLLSVLDVVGLHMAL